MIGKFRHNYERLKLFLHKYIWKQPKKEVTQTQDIRGLGRGIKYFIL